MYSIDIKAHITESEKQFEQKRAEREEHLRVAEELMVEMTKLQGEWRFLQELLSESKSKKDIK